MKKIIFLLIALFIIIPLVSCTENETVTLTFEAFESKYKRADFDALLADPSEFMTDFSKISYTRAESLSPFSFLLNWEKEKTETELSCTNTTYSKKGILFNQSVIFAASILEYTDKTICLIYIDFEIGDLDKTYALTKSVVEKAFELHGDAKNITIGGEESDEFELRRRLSSKDIGAFEVEFTNLTIIYNGLETGKLFLH